MNKHQMVSAIAAKTGMTKVSIHKILTTLEEVAIETLKEGKKVQLTGFFSVKPVYRAARKGYDPIKKVAMDIGPTIGVSVKAGQKLKAAVSELNVEEFANLVDSEDDDAVEAAE